MSTVYPRPPVLVGASLGGISALIAIAQAGEGIASALVLVDIATRMERSGASRIVEFMLGRPDGYASLDEVADAIAEYNPHRPRPSDLKGLEKNLRRGDDGRYRWHWDPRFMSETGPAEVADHPRLMRAAGTLKVPTLLVRGRESDVISLDGVREFREAAPHTEFVDVSGAGHMVAGERNDAFTEAMQGFLDRHDPI